MIAAGHGTPDRQSPRRSGLQPERTALAWQRTSVGFLINGGLLILREAARPSNVLPRLILAGVAFICAVVCASLGRRRNRTLLMPDRLPADLAPVPEVAVLGWSVIVLGVGSVIVLALPV